MLGPGAVAAVEPAVTAYNMTRQSIGFKGRSLAEWCPRKGHTCIDTRRARERKWLSYLLPMFEVDREYRTCQVPPATSSTVDWGPQPP